jgi:tetratricopeptide (TPR) repeat protein
LAVADLNAAYQLFPESRPRWFEGQGIDWQLAGRQELFARMTSADSQNNHYWVIRMIRMLQEGRLNEAMTASEALERIGGFENMRAAAAVAVGDSETFEKICEETVEKLDNTPGTRWAVVESLTMAPVSSTRAGAVLTAAESNCRDRKEGENNPVAFRGLAYYRNGKYSEAIADMEGAVIADRGSLHRAPFWPALAMAYYHAGNPDAARSWLARSKFLLDCCQKLGPDKSDLIINPRSIPPGVWLQFYVLHREAIALIEGEASTAATGAKPADKPAAPANP